METKDVNSNSNDQLVSIDYSTPGGKVTEDYALMVVACDPRHLNDVCDYDRLERYIFSLLKNFTFHTTLIRVPVKAAQTYAVIFAPNQLEPMEGYVYGFRNESAKRFGLEKSNQMNENLVTVYQLLGPEKEPFSPQQFISILEKQLPTLEWWPFGTEYIIEDQVTTPYFDHFSQTALEDEIPWIWLSLQGRYNTLYVHASTCFESALDCWGYENMLIANGSNSRQALPQDKSARIAIIGAGVSGLLFAVKLKRLGYTNIDLLESTVRYGGKTHTIKKDGPYPPGSDEPTYCELGTCYMSPAYDNMINDLQEYLEGNKQVVFGNNVKRGIVTTGQFPANFHPPLIMDQPKYVLRKAEAEMGIEPGTFDDIRAQIKLFEDLLKYILIHEEIFEGATPMPATPPEAFLKTPAAQTFADFLSYYDLNAIIGSLQYGYEVQGYGILDKIPAYYGLIWINAPVMKASIKDFFITIADKTGLSIDDLLMEIIKHIPDGRLRALLQDIISTIDKNLPKRIPFVTAWSEGWGDLWKQVVTKEHLNIIFNVKIDAIRRMSS